jgi:opacity protein-like surface antigen
MTMMKKQASALAGLAGLAALLAIAPLASAADMKGDAAPRTIGSYPAVPVPAPVPIPETFNWYVRADTGYSVSVDRPPYSERGYTTNGYTAGSAIENFHRWDNHGSVGVGVGYVFSRWLRADVTLEARGVTERRLRSTQTYNVSDPLNAVVPGAPTNTVQVTTDDTTSNRSWVGLINGYIDIPTGTRFTPYVGAGIGVVDNRATRNISEAHADVIPSAHPNCAVLPCPQMAPGSSSGSSRTTGNTQGLAWALMAGGAFDLTPGTSIDFGYRYLHLEGANLSQARPNVAGANPLFVGGGLSSLSMGDHAIHEIRAGVRWKIW